MNWHDLPPLSSLRAFEAAARHRSFSGAAREMNVTHAAVSQQVRRLETELGMTLVFRVGRGLQLTEEGLFLSQHLTEGFGKISDALENLSNRLAGKPLNITLTPSFAFSWLMPRLGKLRSEHPEIELMINPSAQVVDLKRDGFDLAIRFGRGEWLGLEVEPFLPARFRIVAAPSLLAGRTLKKPADLGELPWLQELGTDELSLWLKSKGIEVKARRGVTHLPGHMLLTALREGQGVACSASVFVDDDLREGRLVSLFDDLEEEEATGYYLVRRPGIPRGALKELIAWLKRAAREERAEPATNR